MKDLSWLIAIPIAHRGCHAPGIPENSIAAFHEAIKKGFTIELDVRATKDEVLVVFHDNNLFRMTSYDRIIEDCTFAEVRDLALDGTGERIPKLTEVLAVIHGRTGLFIEVKTHPDIGRTEELLAQILDSYAGTCAVLSFDPRVLHWFSLHRPCYIRGQISGGLGGKKLTRFHRFLVKNLLVTTMSRPDFIAYEYTYLSPWVRFLAWIRRVPIIVWTIRDRDTAKKIRETGRNFIFEGFDGRNL